MVLGEEESVLIREVSLFQGLKSTQTWLLCPSSCLSSIIPCLALSSSPSTVFVYFSI